MMSLLLVLLMATPFEDGSNALLKKDWQAAVDAFSLVIVEQPTAKAHVNRGIAYTHLGKLREAFDDCNAAIRLNPQLAEAYYNRGRLYAQAKQKPKALADIGKAIRLKPTSIFYAERGRIHHQDKRYAEATADYRSALKLNSNDPTALNNLAWLQATCPEAKHRDGKSAVELAMQACQLTQFKVPAYVSTLAAAYAEAGEYSQAIAIAEKIGDKHLATYAAGKPVRE